MRTPDRARQTIRATAIAAGVVLVAALAALVVVPLLDVRAEMTATREVVSQQRALSNGWSATRR